MATPFLLTLPKTARIAYPFIRGGVRAGLSSREIERTIRNAGMQISRARSIVPLMRELQAIERASRNIKFIPKGNVINTARLAESLTTIGRQFSYKVTVTGVDQNGLEFDQFIQVTTDRNDLTPADIEAGAIESVETFGSGESAIIIGAVIEEGLQRTTSLIR